MCPTGFNEYKDSCYYFAPRRDRLTWSEATTTCTSFGGYLAEVTSSSENAYITAGLTGRFWIGGSDAVEEGRWIWSHSGSEISEYTNWGPKQPDNYNSQEKCLSYRVSNVWNDLDCSVAISYVCEHAQSQRPTPSGSGSLFYGKQIAMHIHSIFFYFEDNSYCSSVVSNGILR